MPITVIFDPPLPSDTPEDFDTKAFDSWGKMNTFATETNALATDVNAKQATASGAATTATTQAGLAATAKADAEAAAVAALSAYDAFDDRYLGSKAANPTLDNDGNALIEGALYWNSVAKETRVWNATAGVWMQWSVANAVSRSGDTMTGPLALPSNGLAVGTNQLVVSGGNVGVGGTPSTRFHVQGGRLRLDANSEQYATQLNYSAGGGANGHFLGGASDGSFLISNSGGAEKVRVDQPTGSLLVTGSGGLGYGVGSGGTVTQPTSKSTAVTLNKPCGQITMNNAALAAGASVQFQVNNNLAAGADGVVLNITGGTANASSYRVIGYVQGNAFLVRLTNESGGSLSDAVVINFGLFKGATS